MVLEEKNQQTGLDFVVNATASGTRARAGTLVNRRGAIDTPIFMPVGTRATVKGIAADALVTAGSRMLLANTYHLMCRPGLEAFEQLGGIHRFMGWEGGILTDSGGYQVFSLAANAEVTNDGAVFTHPESGDVVHLTPARSIAAQQAMGSDIMMAFDHCVPATADHHVASEAAARTLLWARESLTARGEGKGALFGIVQGACHEDLRRQSALDITALDFDGFAIGGLAVGEEKQEREDFCELTAALLPAERPRYLMGVGTPIDLLEAVHRGIDMFDCIIPTERGAQGIAFSYQGRVRLSRAAYARADEPIDGDCACPACRRHSRAYLHHLFKSREPLGPALVSLHNIHFFHDLMKRMRRAVMNDTFTALYDALRETLAATDGTGPPPKIRTRPKTVLSKLGAFEIAVSQKGHSSVRHSESREIMHSVNPPDDEAKSLYVDQPDLSSLLRNGNGPLVVWDVGLGAAHNAMAAIRCWESMDGPLRPLTVVSFETDCDALRLTMSNRQTFPHIRHPAPGALLKHGTWIDGTGDLRWQLIPGDFLDTLNQAPAPELVLFDPFSSKTNPALWSVSAFSKIYRAVDGLSAMLITYANATAVRAALLTAGFHVAEGVASGPKASTTLAVTEPWRQHHSTPLNWLDDQWLGRFKRSTKRYPEGSSSETRDAIDRAVLGHPQFLNESVS